MDFVSVLFHSRLGYRGANQRKRMSDALRDKLRKFEALLAGAIRTAKAAAGAAAERIRARCEKRRHGRSVSRSGSACPILGRVRSCNGRDRHRTLPLMCPRRR